MNVSSGLGKRENSTLDFGHSVKKNKNFAALEQNENILSVSNQANSNNYLFNDDYDDDDDELLACLSAHETINILSLLQQQNYFKAQVISISYSNANVQISLLEKFNNVTLDLTLLDEWISTPLEPLDFINVIDPIVSGTNQIQVSRAQGFLVLNPDILLSATLVSQSFSCIRRSVLSDRLYFNDRSKAALLGSLTHELFQRSLKDSLNDSKYLYDSAKDCILSHLDDLYALDLDQKSVLEELEKRFDSIRLFSERYLKSSPSIDGVIELGYSSEDLICFNEILDIEENLWSPKFGLKGKIDVTMQASVKSKPKQFDVIPFELKTGRGTDSISHRAQTSLYSLMMQNTYESCAEYGVLFYINQSKLVKVSPCRQELVSLVVSRNELAYYCKTKNGKLPDMINNDFICKNCYANSACAVFGKVEQRNEFPIIKSLADHIDKNSFKFFTHWNNILTLEESSISKDRKDIWSIEGDKRQSLGKCWNKLMIVSENIDKSKRFGMFNYFFKVWDDSCIPKSYIVEGDSVVISSGKKIAMAIGFVTKITEYLVSVSLDRSIRFSKTKQENYYRIDSDRFSSGMSMARMNLLSLFMLKRNHENSSYIDKYSRLRELIVQLKSPLFDKNILGISIENEEYLHENLSKLNPAQKDAVEQAIKAKDYCLILGTPGSGKTFAIVTLVKILYQLGKTVLITTYTHAALDNLLLRIRKDEIPMLRLGNSDKIAPELKVTDCRNFETNLHEIYDSYRIVATTCLGISHPLFSKKYFDYCIVDEAAQISLPVAIGPLKHAQKFVLVGDHNQLPPVVQNEEARKGGLEQSLFEVLACKYPEFVCTMNYQYRMNKNVMEISNHLFYSHTLVCGNEKTRNKRLNLESKEFETNYWQKSIVENDVIFLNTELCEFNEEDETGVSNNFEALMVFKIIEFLVNVCKINTESVGVTSPFRAQLEMIRKKTKEVFAGIQILTIDQFQGKEKECMIISFVKTKSIGELLKDWRRLNVALTRAKYKIVMVGDMKILRTQEMYRKMEDLLESKAAILNLS